MSSSSAKPRNPKASPVLDSANTEMLHYSTAELEITILGGVRLTGLDRLRVTLKVESVKGRGPAVRQGLDLYSQKQVAVFCELLSEQLEIPPQGMSQIIGELTSALEVELLPFVGQ